MTRVVAALAALVLLAGCGGSSKGIAPNPDAATHLTVTVWPEGRLGDSLTWKLECDPPGGDHPDPEAACAELAAVPDPFGYPEKTPRCNEIPGATEDLALITGTYRGRKVRAEFDRKSGCVFDRWDRLSAVFQTGF